MVWDTRVGLIQLPLAEDATDLLDPEGKFCI